MLEDSSDESTTTQVIIRKDQEPNWKKIYLTVNVCLFKSYSGKPLYFHVNTQDLSLKKKYEELICTFGGCGVNYSDINVRTACLVENNSRLYEQKPYFKLSYLIDCVMADALLNINDYTHSKYLGSNKDFMKIFFWEKGVFVKNIVKRYCGSSDECDTIDEFPLDSRTIINCRKLDKNTRELFTRDEKEAILKFIIAHKKLDGLRGNPIWKLMEKKGVCPRRTYQSMKNHFLKKMVFELDSFEFLSEIEKSKIKKTL